MAVIKLAPWGLTDAHSEVFDHSGYAGIKTITVTYAGGIDHIRVQYLDKEGNGVWLGVGGCGGDTKRTIELEHPKEYLVGMKGHYGLWVEKDNRAILKSLQLFSNLRTFDVFGVEAGTPFEVHASGGRIVGFHGSTNNYIGRLGVYVEPLSCQPITSPKISCLDDDQIKRILDSMLRMIICPRERNTLEASTYSGGIVCRNAGPWGGDGGEPWDDGISGRIKQFIVTLTDGAISSLRHIYDLNGVSHQTPIRGKLGTFQGTMQIKFEQADEYLERISGFIGPLRGNPKAIVLKSLKFYTNKATYGPVGEEIGEFFSSSSAKGEILGFFGRSGAYVDAIGVHLKYLTDEFNNPQ